MEVMPEAKNAEPAIVATESGRVTVVKAEQPQKR
jgi:hypothetical protein